MRIEAVDKHVGGCVAKRLIPRRIGYARVSTEDQNLRVQIEALEKEDCFNIYKEKRSATRGPRPELELALTDLREGDTLIVWKLDRLIRNARDLYKILDRLEETGAEVRSISEPHLDLKTPVGGLMMGLSALLAEFEIRQIQERTSKGIAAMNRAGLKNGAKLKLSPVQHVGVVKDFKAGMSKAEIARKRGISPVSVTNYLNRPLPKAGKRS